MPGEDKTEKATPKRRNDERKKGNILFCQDIIAVSTLIGSVVMLRVMFGTFVTEISEFFAKCSRFAVGTMDSEPGYYMGELVFEGVKVFVSTAGPMLLATIFVALAATFAQTRFLVAGERIKPKLNKISPISGFKRVFSARSLVEALKGLIKIVILLVFIYNSLVSLMNIAAGFMYSDIGSACKTLFEAIFNMLMQVCLAFIVIAFFDFLYQRWEFERQMKMSKQEIKEEYKQTEGDPQIKNRIRQVQRSMAQQRMMQQVPEADVIIRNPTHFAVALRYKQGEDAAPVVLAKGQDELAARIVAKGEEAKVPIIENVPLARALYAQAEVDHEIPPDLYAAVAEVLVYVYKLENKLVIENR
ncbi:flagellar biosynthesis protein FlhB [Acutalibacter muris]|jgi:flagellar biosynthetic protein FlhB|uniref:flagellar biosynthesis protein FlhB n=1 Tax=Acutalibacter muris TaxID=1796620 RepID=UPI001C3EEE94|nr:flagellar biosynthesis protein FlhB [Acutalibacter muris]MCI9192069.1 flagellar biosynthesis protein FlhB [Acutalibacter muris]MCI9543609.1 flagellar biosynthesis protein FlhB [Acutalibacter muris]